MLSSLVFGAALAAPSAPVPKDADPVPAGPAPWVVYLKADAGGQTMLAVSRIQKVTQARQVATTENGKPVTKIIREEVTRPVTSYVSLADQGAKFTTAGGTPASADAVCRRARGGLVVLVSADGKPVGKGWLRAVDPETVVITAEALASIAPPRPQVAAPSQPPRLVLLGTGADGRVQVAYNPAADANGAFYDRGNRVVFINNGAGMQPIFFTGDGVYSPNPTPATTEAPVKPLEEVTFDAYDRTGKLVPRADALTRLKAGGLVLVSGDTRAPDESFLKVFRGDLLVLSSPELLNVPVGSKPKAVAGRAAPLPAAAPALPPVVPAVIPPPVAVPAKPIRLRIGVARPVAAPALPAPAKPAAEKSQK